MQTARLVVLWKPPPGMLAELREQLPDWQWQSLQTMEALQQQAQPMGYGAGLFFLDNTLDSQQLAALEDILSKNNTLHWIGLASPEALQQPRLQTLIAAYAVDYHTLPLRPSLLSNTLGHVLGMAALRRNVTLSPTAPREINGILGISPVMAALRQQIRAYAATDAPVLITGESGTGKEIAAHAMHRLSKRAKAPFVPVNCGAFPEGLIQSELFGHKKGAFTGAILDKEGKAEAAHSGSLFLDEVGELPKNLQVHLLRFLQEGTIEKIGVSRPIPVDVRTIAATNVDLAKAVKAGQFREDLFYRLNVLGIHLPPLRERPEDIAVLADHYLARFKHEGPEYLLGFTPAAYEQLTRHTWPGNVRELINCIRRAICTAQQPMIGPADLGLGVSTTVLPRSLSKIRAAADKRAIEATLRFTGNNISAASRMLKISRLSLYRLMEKYDVEFVRERK